MDFPSEVMPSRKVTVPVGTPEVTGLTVAVKVRLAAFELAPSPVVVPAFCTTWLSIGEEAAAKLRSPL